MCQGTHGNPALALTCFAVPRATGEWAAGTRSGFGTYWYPGGDIYQGDWRAGKRHGDGSQHCAALEAQYVGEWCALLLSPGFCVGKGARQQARPAALQPF